MSRVIYPGKNWMRYANSEDAGFSHKGLEKAYKFYKEIGSGALLVIYDGAVLLSWGEVERRFLCHSMRKSLMNALIGIYEAKGIIKLNKTLKELNIDDIPSLAESEKNATVSDLLKSMSGVYLPAQYEDTNTVKPKRGSSKPGKKHFYNNWDFNVLNTIFEKETGRKFFSEFKKQIARPLQMEEFRIADGYYHLEYGRSIHPAYPLRMSAKDLARFGLLYLRKGKWKNKQIIPEGWIKKSTVPYGFDGSITGAFGYLWFISNDKYKSRGMYSSLGAGGQCVSVIPKEKIVFVHRVNTYKWKSVSEPHRLKLLELILKAKTNTKVKHPKLTELKDNPQMNLVNIDTKTNAKLTGKYKHNDEIWNIKRIGKSLFLFNQFGDGYKMIPQNENEFILEDSLRKLKIKYSDDKMSIKITLKRPPEKDAVFYNS